MSRFIVHSEAVVLPTSDGFSVEPAAVHIDGHSIVRVDPGPAPAGASSLGRKVLAPAFVNAHTHIAMSAFRGVGLDALGGNVVEDLYFRLESRYRPGDVAAFARVAALEALLSGVAVVFDHYYAGLDVARACQEMGLSAVIAPTLQDLEGPGVPNLEAQLDDTVAIAGDAGLAEAGVVAALGPHATDTVSAALWTRIADLAEKHGLPQHLHCAQSREEYERARERHGTSPIRWLVDGGWLDASPRALLVHGLFVDTADLAALDPERVMLGYCPGSQVQYCFPANYAGWRDAGFGIAVGTDCGACNDSMNVQQELRWVAGGPLYAVPADPAYAGFWRGEPVAAGTIAAIRDTRRLQGEIDPAALLRTVWDTPGRLHPGLPCGRIAAGARANLLVFDPDHPAFWPGTDVLRALALQDVGPAIDRMMVNGRWLSESGAHQRSLVDSDRTREVVKEARQRLVRMLS